MAKRFHSGAVTVRKFIYLVALTAFVFAARAELPQSVIGYGRDFAQGVAACRAAYVATTNQLPMKYMKDLAALHARFQEAGDLDSLLAVKNEAERFRKAKLAEPDPFEPVPEMTPDDIVASPPELRKLQEQYLVGFTDAFQSMKAGLVDIGERYKAQIKAAQASLTKAGLIEEAIEVRQEVERITTLLDAGEIDRLLEKLGTPAAPSPQPPKREQAAAEDDEAIFTKTAASPAAIWKYRGSLPFSRDLRPKYFAPDVPDEIKGSFSKARGIATLIGQCHVPARQVDNTLCSWNGRAFVWDVADDSALPADFRFRSRTISSGDDCGPHVEIAVFQEADGGGARFLKSLSFPMQRAEEIAKITREAPKSRRYTISWARGQRSSTFEVQEGAKLRLMVGAVLHNAGETCEMSFQIEQPSE